MINFSILITTKNRLQDLKVTLSKIHDLIANKNLECIICDDGSTDGTSRFIKENYKTVKLIKNSKGKGLIFSRNRLLNLTKAKYAITLDDDAHIVSENTLEKIENYFQNNESCAVIAFRIFWGKELPKNLNHSEYITRVKSFVGCGHAWNMGAWRDIPNYPDWFIFYGEEDFASFQLFKKGWEVHYLPDILIHHRVDVKSRIEHEDYRIRLRRSLRSGWYLYLLFYPKNEIPKRLIYTLLVQFKMKVLKGNLRALIAIFQALWDVLVKFPKLINNRNCLTNEQLYEYLIIPETVIYWKPKKE